MKIIAITEDFRTLSLILTCPHVANIVKMQGKSSHAG